MAKALKTTERLPVENSPKIPLQTLRVVKRRKAKTEGFHFTTPLQVYELMKPMANLDREHFRVLHLDGKNRILADELISVGSLNQAIIHPREVFKGAVNNGSAAVICVHNHPTGDPHPSHEDKEVTGRLRACAGLIGIALLDHIIIGDNTFYSFCGHGWEGCPSTTWNGVGAMGEANNSAEGLQRDLDLEDRLGNSMSKLNYIGWSLGVVVSEDEAMCSYQIEGLACLVRDVQDLLKDVLECQFYRKMDRPEISKKESATTGGAAAVIHTTPEKITIEGNSPYAAQIQYVTLKSKNGSRLLLFDCDDSFKFLFDDARKASKILGIQTGKTEIDGMASLYCSLPRWKKDEYVDRLIAAGETVAICART